VVSDIRGEKMEKIVYIALDERPCNYKFPKEIFVSDEYEIITPSTEIMPYKREPGDFAKLKNFLLEETKDAYGLVISMDTLLYGGLVPSRIHYLDEETIKERMSVIEAIKENNPRIIIYAFQIIMRCPSGNGADEEPLYYKTEGKKIHLNGLYTHKDRLGIIKPEERANWDALNVNQEYLKDFESRRRLNVKLDLQAIDYAKNDLFDFLILCQDDAGEFGYPAMDQEVVTEKIKSENLRMKVYAYSGADELGVIMVSRMVNSLLKQKPKYYLKYPSLTSGTVVPVLEDRYLDNTIKYQIISSGGIIVSSLEEADIVLVALMGATRMFPTVYHNQRDIDVMTNLIETFEFINWAITKKPIIIADLFYLNSGSLEVLNLIKENNLLTSLAAYAGWNTASNTLGTCIAQGNRYLHKGFDNHHLAFLIKRYIEDIGYCNVVRTSVTKKLDALGMNYFDVLEQKGKASDLVGKELKAFIDEHLESLKNMFVLENINLPWKRMFEVDFDISIR
jgi:hypothetical protein